MTVALRAQFNKLIQLVSRTSRERCPQLIVFLTFSSRTLLGHDTLNALRFLCLYPKDTCQGSRKVALRHVA